MFVGLAPAGPAPAVGTCPGGASLPIECDPKRPWPQCPPQSYCYATNTVDIGPYFCCPICEIFVLLLGNVFYLRVYLWCRLASSYALLQLRATASPQLARANANGIGTTICRPIGTNSKRPKGWKNCNVYYTQTNINFDLAQEQRFDDDGKPLMTEDEQRKILQVFVGSLCL